MDALVSFAESIYRAPGVEPGLLTLQDRYGLDVSVVLACAWYGARGGGRLNPEQVDLLEDAVAEWRAQVIQPLRGARRVLKGELGQSEAAQALRENVKTCELDAERIALARLEAHLGSFAATEGETEAQAADAAHNLSVCLQAGEVAVVGETRAALVALLRAAFPSLSDEHIEHSLRA